MSWEHKTIAGQRHRKRGKKVQAIFLGEWCTVPSEMWDHNRCGVRCDPFGYRPKVKHAGVMARAVGSIPTPIANINEDVK